MKHAKIENSQLTFTDGRFYQREDGRWVPSVTTVLEAYPKPYALLQWMKEQGHKTDEIIAAAGRRGTSVHNMTEAYDRGEEVTLFDSEGRPNCTLEEWGMFERYVEFCEVAHPEWEEIESRYIGEHYAGTIDRVGHIPGVGRVILDIKTSNGIYDTYWMQTAAYRSLYDTASPGDRSDGCAILWLNAKTRGPAKDKKQGKGWQLLTQMDAAEHGRLMLLFTQVFAVWDASTAAKEPRQWVYQLRHRRADV